MAVIENSGAHANTTDAEEKTVELRGYLKEFRNALNEEIAAVKKSGQTSTLLYGGHKIPSKGQFRHAKSAIPDGKRNCRSCK